MSSLFSLLPRQAQEALSQLSAAIEGVLPVAVQAWPIAVSQLPSEAPQAELYGTVQQWANRSKRCLYYFECTSSDLDLSSVERAFSDAKAHESNDRAYPRLNAQSRCFYVGSSQAVAKRFSEHLGYGASATYALQLLHWARPLSLQLEFVCAKYAENTPYAVVQALEDALWNTRKPMFGRQGRK